MFVPEFLSDQQRYEYLDQIHAEQVRYTAAVRDIMHFDREVTPERVYEPVTVSNALTAFVRKYCAGTTANSSLCNDTETCLIMQGKPCRYFKEAVFPICDPSYKFTSETKQYDRLLELYKKLDPNIVESDAEVRRCECGEPLKPRQRFCDVCSRKRRRESNRGYNRKRAG